VGTDPVLARTAVQVAEAATVRDFAPGPVHMTGNPLDVALSGKGFFVVNTAQGARYTRNGSFTVHRDGYTGTQPGQGGQGDGGGLQINSQTGADVEVGTDGSIAVDGQVAGTLKVVDFGATPALLPEGSSLFAPVPGTAPQPLDPRDVQITPRSLEGANV